MGQGFFPVWLTALSLDYLNKCIGPCYGLSCVHLPPNSYVEALMLNELVFEDGAIVMRLVGL